MTIQPSELRTAMESLRIPAFGGVVTLRMEDLKKAFRERALQSHPDRAEALGMAREILEVEFKKVNESYRTLLEFLKSREKVKQARAAQAATQQPGTFFYKGRIPERKLRFGEFLYYSGNIDWRTFIAALVWQGQNRPRFGEIAVKLGFMGKSDLLELIRVKKIGEKFGDTALRTGKLTAQQLFMVIGRQRSYQRPIGMFFTLKCRMPSEFLARKLTDHSLHNAKYR